MVHAVVNTGIVDLQISIVVLAAKAVARGAIHLPALLLQVCRQAHPLRDPLRDPHRRRLLHLRPAAHIVKMVVVDLLMAMPSAILVLGVKIAAHSI